MSIGHEFCEFLECGKTFRYFVRLRLTILPHRSFFDAGDSFWKTAAPVMALLIPLFLYDNIRKGFEFLKRRSLSRRAGMD